MAQRKSKNVTILESNTNFPVTTQENAPVLKEKRKILFVASEARPFIATGGLADVIGSLPQALARSLI